MGLAGNGEGGWGITVPTSSVDIRVRGGGGAARLYSFVSAFPGLGLLWGGACGAAAVRALAGCDGSPASS